MVEWDVAGIFGTEMVPSSASEPQFHGTNYQRFLPLPGSGCAPIDWNTAGFHVIIGKDFREPEYGHFRDPRGVPHLGEVIYYTDMPVKPGLFKFMMQRYYRSPKLPQHKLPYGGVPVQQRPASAGSGSSGPNFSATSASKTASRPGSKDGSPSGGKRSTSTGPVPNNGGFGSRSTPSPRPKPSGAGVKRTGFSAFIRSEEKSLSS
jgi:hypothetical protein